VTLAWDPNVESNLGGYILYYGELEGTVTNSIHLPKDVTTNTVSGLHECLSYFFFVTATNLPGLESNDSNTVTNRDCAPISPNSAPVANPQFVATLENTSVSIILSGFDSDGDDLSFRVVLPPGRGTLSGDPPNLEYTPDTNSTQSDFFTFLVRDSRIDSIPATVSIRVDPSLNPPNPAGESSDPGILRGITECCPVEFVGLNSFTGILAPLSTVVDVEVSLGPAATDSVSHQFYLVIRRENTFYLLTIDGRTGEVVRMPALDTGLTFLEFDPLTGGLFGVTECCPTRFVRVEPSSGLMVPLSNLADDSLGFSGVAAQDSKRHQFFLVVHRAGVPYLAAVDTQTGLISEGSKLEKDLIFLGFDAAAGGLFGITECCPSQFVLIDPLFGVLASLNVVGDASVDLSGGVAAIDAEEHQLFLVVRREGVSYLLTIDVRTGDVIRGPELRSSDAMSSGILRHLFKETLASSSDSSPNTAPLLSTFANVTIAENTFAVGIQFTVADAETPANFLTLKTYSSDPSLIRPEYIFMTGDGSNWRMALLPEPNRYGAATITVSVSDSMAVTKKSFRLTVSAPPAISVISNQTVESASLTTVGFRVSDSDTPTARLVVTGSSSNPALLPHANLLFAGTGTERTATFLPLPNQSGTAIITVRVWDGNRFASTQFRVLVLPPHF
jgi:hypothetical protein